MATYRPFCNSLLTFSSQLTLFSVVFSPVTPSMRWFMRSVGSPFTSFPFVNPSPIFFHAGPFPMLRRCLSPTFPFPFNILNTNAHLKAPHAWSPFKPVYFHFFFFFFHHDSPTTNLHLEKVNSPLFSRALSGGVTCPQPLPHCFPAILRVSSFLIGGCHTPLFSPRCPAVG